MTYSEDLNLTAKEKLAKAAVKEMLHIKYLTKPYYKKSKKFMRLLKYSHCFDCNTTKNLKIKVY